MDVVKRKEKLIPFRSPLKDLLLISSEKIPKKKQVGN